MKTIIMILSFLFLMSGKDANAQKKIKFYYYPAANVYYNTTTAVYSFIESGNWVSASSLPATFKIKHTPRQVVYHSNAEVWASNYQHRMSFAHEHKVIDAGYKESNNKPLKGPLLKGGVLKRKEKL